MLSEAVLRVGIVGVIIVFEAVEGPICGICGVMEKTGGMSAPPFDKGPFDCPFWLLAISWD